MQPFDGAPARVRFESLDCDVTRDGACDVTVHLELNGNTYRASESGLQTQQGMVKAATKAALTATLAAADDEIHLQLVGVKAVRAFDGWVVIARLSSKSPEHPRLLGAAPCEKEEELPKAAVLAVLDATNRVLARALE